MILREIRVCFGSRTFDNESECIEKVSWTLYCFSNSLGLKHHTYDVLNYGRIERKSRSVTVTISQMIHHDLEICTESSRQLANEFRITDSIDLTARTLSDTHRHSLIHTKVLSLDGQVVIVMLFLILSSTFCQKNLVKR
jgi:hypothetical protein